MLGQVCDIIAQGGDGWHDEEDAVMITEFDKCSCLIKMVSGGFRLRELVKIGIPVSVFSHEPWWSDMWWGLCFVQF